MADNIIQSTGRRKTSVARVTMVPGSGNIIVNGKDLDQYFDFETDWKKNMMYGDFAYFYDKLMYDLDYEKNL